MKGTYKKIMDTSEKIIKGNWIMIGDKIVEDESCQRIEYLTKHVLIKIGVSKSGWEKLYYDKSTKSYWELSYPDSHMHGGGPPQLALKDDFETLKEKYNLDL
jgi:hypothetical protein